METGKPDFVRISTVQGQLTASIMKSHLESEGIPVLLQYESAGQVFGLIVDGLGEVHILVPEHLADTAKAIISPQEHDPHTP